jgi:quinohemoprotein ethanol dehydrogenase
VGDPRTVSTDGLHEQVVRRLVDEGVPAERAEVLAQALLDAQPDDPSERGNDLDHLANLLDRSAREVGEAGRAMEAAGAAAAGAGERAAAAVEEWRRYRDKDSNGSHAPHVHPIQAAEREVEHLRDVAVKGESPATPAILAGGVLAVAVPLAALMIVLALGIAYLVTRGGGETQTAPAFSSQELAALPTDNWLTNGGSLANQRFSPLTQIDTRTVSRLKGVWLTHLQKSGTAAKYSAEGQPLEYKGVLYVPTGADDVFAVSVATGKILWKYNGNLDPSISTICCGWLSRGVALGEGKVYFGRLDGKLVALDQKTGELTWSTQVERWQNGYSITAAPLYVDGMVITGISGGEFGIRGRVTAYDAATGKLKWQFYTTAPGTWAGDSWKTGGAPMWQTPSVDPKLGLIYFTTGNANPDNDGSKRAGKNLYSASFVALDLHTGKLRWYYQMVHHDIWDYDAPSPTVLFDVKIGGRMVHGIGEAEKTGWLYLLDRTNGKPIFPTPERPVPQSKAQKTWPTQPIPSYAPFVPHTLSNEQYNALVKQVRAAASGKPVDVARARAMYTPYGKAPVAYTPGPQGGTNWQPSSYNPGTHMFYVCAQSGTVASTSETEPPATRAKGKPQPSRIGSTLTVAGGFGSNPGTFTAIDATTGKIAWQKHWPESCYSGSTTTAGNLVFVGRNDGHLQAYDARNGSLLWSFQTGAGANSTASVFQRDGTQYLAFYAGGNALAGTAHGDNLWLFSLNGTLGSAQEAGPGTAITHAGETPATTPTTPATTTSASATGNAAAGKTVFAENCSTCHGATGHGGNGGPDLTSIAAAKQLSNVIKQVTNGGGGMPPFKGTLTKTQIDEVATYVVDDITHGG